MKNTLKKRAVLAAALLIGTSAITLNAANIKKSIEAGFYDIKVTNNGQYKAIPPDREPFMYNDRVYVAVADIAAITGYDAKWDSTSKTVKLTSNGTDSSLEVAKLKAEIDALNKKLDEYEKAEAEKEEAEKEDPNKDVLPNIAQKDLNNMVEDLVDDYEGEFDINWRFDLKPNATDGCLELKVSLKSSYESTTFTEVTEDELEDFLDEVCYDIQKSLGKLTINGTLTDSKGKTLTKFAYSKTSSLSMQHQKEDLQLERLNTILEDEFSYLTKIPDFFSSNIAIKDVFAESTRSFRKVNVSVISNLASDDELANWNKLYEKATTSQKRILLKDLVSIASLVEEYFDMEEDDISVSVYDASGKVLLATYDATDFEVNEWTK